MSWIFFGRWDQNAMESIEMFLENIDFSWFFSENQRFFNILDTF